MSKLEAINLTKKYNEQTALSNLNFSLKEGEIFCLLGQNGAGKTTTINLFLGFTNATSGEAKINDVTVKPNDVATKRFVAYIPEVVQLYGNLDGIE
ncbi:MAG: ATP-binding cassette domain-containing protein, partial [Ferruginibacter sp.]